MCCIIGSPGAFVNERAIFLNILWKFIISLSLKKGALCRLFSMDFKHILVCISIFSRFFSRNSLRFLSFLAESPTSALFDSYIYSFFQTSNKKKTAPAAFPKFLHSVFARCESIAVLLTANAPCLCSMKAPAAAPLRHPSPRQRRQCAGKIPPVLPSPFSLLSSAPECPTDRDRQI